jgi:hypothetical protein
VSPRLRCRVLALVGVAVLAPTSAMASADGRFDEANELARAGDYPAAIRTYADLAAAGHESASLYWNWAQASAARLARRYRLDLIAALLLGLSLGAHALGRLRPGPSWPAPVAWLTLGLGLLAAAAPAAGMLARPTGAVVRRGAPLLDAASPSAEVIGSLREGEVVPILKPGGDWLHIEDASGARGWAHRADVRRLDVPPAPAER